MDLQIQDKKALVTGSTAGIGLAIARELAAEGAQVIINGRTAERIKSATQIILKSVPQASLEGLVCDFGNPSSVEKAISGVSGIDILINNVGIFEPRKFADISDEAWMHLFDVNVMSGVRLSRHCLPAMLERNWGRIVFISSESGVQIPAEMIHYGVSKTAQIALANGLARLTKGSGVTVNSVLPGSTWSEGAARFIGDMARERRTSEEAVTTEFFRTVRPSSLLQRFAKTEEVAALVVYLCSARASATNGAALRVDGGTLTTIL